MKKVAIFCSAANHIDPIYFDKAAELGHWMGEQGLTLVYGGLNCGLMECVAQAMKTKGGKTFGVVPSKLEEHGQASRYLDVCFYTCDLSDRKETMIREADVFVALPGGIGTLDEAFTLMASNAIGYQRKKVIFYNINGFYDGLLTWFNQLREKRFIHRSIEGCMEVAGSFEELTNKITKLVYDDNDTQSNRDWRNHP